MRVDSERRVRFYVISAPLNSIRVSMHALQSPDGIAAEKNSTPSLGNVQVIARDHKKLTLTMNFHPPRHKKIKIRTKD